MLFNSLDFAWFLPIVFALYWAFLWNKIKSRNFFLLIASYVFYGWWDYRFLSLIVLSSIIDYFVALTLEKTKEQSVRKRLLAISLLANLGMLGFFKYFNFFTESFVEMSNAIGFQANPSTLDIVLPVGISFYTFQTLSYTIDVYRRKLKAEPDWIAFFTYVSFFPQLVAGPIERASKLLPQFKIAHRFSYPLAVEGCRQILYGFFKKVVIADNCAPYVDKLFANPELFTGPELAMGAVFFAFQIYGDFSGYSDIAIGTAKLLGFDLMTNFRYPYFSRDMAEFWRRWHISLSTWFRDYLYIPLGGSRGGKYVTLRNVAIIFLVSGFWHGANWTFIFWGALHAAFFIPILLLEKNRANLDVVAQNRRLPNFRELFSMLTTFSLACFAWIFFRAKSVGQAFDYIGDIFTQPWSGFKYEIFRPKMALLLLIFLVLEWMCRREDNPLNAFAQSKIRKFVYAFLFTAIVLYGSFEKQEFIYFNF